MSVKAGPPFGAGYRGSMKTHRDPHDAGATAIPPRSSRRRSGSPSGVRCACGWLRRGNRPNHTDSALQRAARPSVLVFRQRPPDMHVCPLVGPHTFPGPDRLRQTVASPQHRPRRVLRHSAAGTRATTAVIRPGQRRVRGSGRFSVNSKLRHNTLLQRRKIEYG